MNFTKGDKVSFKIYTFTLEGTVVRHKKGDGLVTVEAPVVFRQGGIPFLDTRETMYWDLEPGVLTQI